MLPSVKKIMNGPNGIKVFFSDGKIYEVAKSVDMIIAEDLGTGQLYAVGDTHDPTIEYQLGECTKIYRAKQMGRLWGVQNTSDPM